MQLAVLVPPAPQTASSGAAALGEMLGATAANGNGAPDADVPVAGDPPGDGGAAAGLAFAQALAASLMVPPGVQPQAAAQSAPAGSSQGRSAGAFAREGNPSPVLFAPPPAAPGPAAAGESKADPARVGAAVVDPPLPGQPLPQPAPRAGAQTAAQLVVPNGAARSQAGADKAIAETPAAYKAPAAVPPTSGQDGGFSRAAEAAQAAPQAAPQTAVQTVAAPSPAAMADAAASAQPQALAAASGDGAPANRSPTRAEARAAGKADARSRNLQPDAPSAPGSAKGLARPQGFALASVQAEAAEAFSGGAERSGADRSQDAKPVQTAQPAEDAPQTAGPVPAAQVAVQGVRADHTTVPRLTSQIVRKLDAKITSFDLELHPAGLGRVGVKVEISPSGAISAALSFDNPQAAQELRGRSEELRNALQQAGFNLSDAGLSFDLSGGRGRWAQADDANPQANRAFAAAADQTDDLLSTVTDAAARLNRRGASGVDIRI